MKFKNKILVISILAILFANCLVVNLANGNPMPPSLEDIHKSIEFDFPLNGTVDLVVSDHFNLEAFRWGFDYERLGVCSEFLHDSNIMKLEQNYLNCTYRNATFSANNFGIIVQKINNYRFSEVFWWHVFNGTNMIAQTIGREFSMDNDYNPIINITNLNVSTEKLPVAFDMFAREYNAPPDYWYDLPNDSPKSGHWKVWGKYFVIGIVAFLGISFFVFWLLSDEGDFEKVKQEREEPKSLTSPQSEVENDNDLSFCPECGYSLREFQKQKEVCE